MAQRIDYSEPPPEAVRLFGRNSLLTRLAAFCRELQREVGDRPFFLSGRIAAAVVEVSPAHAHRWLVRLVADGILEQVSVGNLVGRKASEFRYKGS